jgi:hypothetical protein
MSHLSRECRVFLKLILQAVVLLASISCSTGTPRQTNMSTNAICYVGSNEYQEKVKSFNVTPEEARNLLEEHIRGQRAAAAPSQKVAIGAHSIIVGSAYHFYMPTKTGGIPLTGYYVDGNTGKVEFRNLEGSVPYPYQK